MTRTLKTPVEWSMKRKTDDGWQFISLAEIAGKTLLQVLTEFAGQEVVAEYIIRHKKYYFCGTGSLKERMKGKGVSVTFAEAIESLRSVNPELLEQVCPGESVEDVFPGSRVEHVEVR